MFMYFNFISRQAIFDISTSSRVSEDLEEYYLCTQFIPSAVFIFLIYRA